MPTQVMKFGVRRISVGAEPARESMASAHRYYNQLMEIALRSRAEYREIRSRCVPELDEVEKRYADTDARISEILASVRKQRQRDSMQRDGTIIPTKTPATDEQRSELTDLRAAKKVLGARAKELRAAFKIAASSGNAEFKRRTEHAKSPHAKRAANDSAMESMLHSPDVDDVWKELARSRFAARDARAEARAACGLSPGTYAAVEDAVDAACKTAQGDPRFRRFDGGRKIGLQIIGRKLTGADFYAGSDPRLGVVSRTPLTGRKAPAKRVARDPRSKHNFTEYAVVRLPIGKGNGRSTIEVEAKLHRPVPSDALITWAYLVPRRNGMRTTYTLQLTVNTAEPLTQHPAGIGECNVDLRWSRSPKDEHDASIRGLIVANVNGEAFELDGHEYQARATKFARRGGAYAGMAKARELRGIADKHFDAAISILVTWMETHASIVPQWLTDATSPKPGEDGRRGRAGIGKWERHSLLARVANQWVDSLPDGVALRELWGEWVSSRRANDLDLFCSRDELCAWLSTRGVSDEYAHMGIWLEWWRRKDAHLIQWAADADKTARLNRMDQYRRKAAILASQFERCVVHGFDLADAAKRKPADKDDDELHRQARYQRVCAAPSEFIECLKAAFGKDRFELRKIERSCDDETTVGARDSMISAESDASAD